MAHGTKAKLGETEKTEPGRKAMKYAVLGNLFPPAAGVGQLYTDQYIKGFLISTIQILNALLAVMLIGIPLYIITALYAIYDAKKNATETTTK